MHIPILAAIVVAGLIPSTTTYVASSTPIVEEAVISQPRAVSSEIEAIKRVFGDDSDAMYQVALCESGASQFTASGSVVRNPKTPDVGAFQVNVEYHGEAAKRLGLDLYSVDGNVAYAKVLFDRNGLRDWSASKHCWSDKI